MTRDVHARCDLCGQVVDCAVVYLRHRTRDGAGSFHDAGFGTLDICRPCLRKRPDRGHMGRPRTRTYDPQ